MKETDVASKQVTFRKHRQREQRKSYRVSFMPCKRILMTLPEFHELTYLFKQGLKMEVEKIRAQNPGDTTALDASSRTRGLSPMRRLIACKGMNQIRYTAA